MSGGAFTSVINPDGLPVRKYLDVGQNPPKGVIVTYYLKQRPKQPITLTFSDAQGAVIRTFTSRDLESTEKPKELKAPAEAGWNRFVWDMRYTPVTKIEGKDPAAEMAFEGPIVAPGSYRVTLAAGDASLTEQFDVVKPGGIPATQEDLDAQHELLLRIYRKLGETVTSINRMRDLRRQLDDWSTRADQFPDGKPLGEAAKALRDRLLEIEKQIQIPDLRPGWADNLNQGVRLLVQLAALNEVVELGDYRPTDQSYEAYDYFAGKIDETLGGVDALIESELPELNARIAAAKIGAIVPKK
jgi:hypothetical protein